MNTEQFYESIHAISALSVDFADSDESPELFDLVRNKLLYAVTGKTSAELIGERLDAAKANMGLTTWKGADLYEDDVVLAENYLSAEEATGFHGLVTLFLEFADGEARRRRQLFQHEWRGKLDAFLADHKHDILQGAGEVTDTFAETFAKEQYVLFCSRETTPE